MAGHEVEPVHTLRAGPRACRVALPQRGAYLLGRAPRSQARTHNVGPLTQTAAQLLQMGVGVGVGAKVHQEKHGRIKRQEPIDAQLPGRRVEFGRHGGRVDDPGAGHTDARHVAGEDGARGQVAHGDVVRGVARRE